MTLRHLLCVAPSRSQLQRHWPQTRTLRTLLGLGLVGFFSLAGPLPLPGRGGLTVAIAVAEGVTGSQTSHSPAADKDLSPALAELAQTAEQTVGKTKDLAASLTITQHNPATGEVSTVTAQLQMLLPDVLRLSYLTPDFVAGQILVLQQDTNDLRVYLPVTHQIMVQDLRKTMSAHGVNIAVTLQSVISLPPRSLFVLNDEGAATLPEGSAARVVRATPRQAVDSLGYERIWVDPHSGFARQIVMYDVQGRPLYTIKIANLKTNLGLTRAKAVALPKDAELVAAN